MLTELGKIGGELKGAISWTRTTAAYASTQASRVRIATEPPTFRLSAPPTLETWDSSHTAGALCSSGAVGPLPKASGVASRESARPIGVGPPHGLQHRHAEQTRKPRGSPIWMSRDM